MTDIAIADSTQRDGSVITCNVASVSVIECASVKAVTILKTSTKALLKLGTGRQCFSTQIKTAGSNSASKNSMWSNPIHMCQTPVFRNSINCFSLSGSASLNFCIDESGPKWPWTWPRGFVASEAPCVEDPHQTAADRQRLVWSGNSHRLH